MSEKEKQEIIEEANKETKMSDIVTKHGAFLPGGLIEYGFRVLNLAEQRSDERWAGMCRDRETEIARLKAENDALRNDLECFEDSESIEKARQAEKQSILDRIDDKIGECKDQIRFHKENANKLGCKHTIKVLEELKNPPKEGV